MSEAERLKASYGKALKESIKANDAKHKVTIDKLRVKCEKVRLQKYNAIRSKNRTIRHNTKIAKVLINMLLDGEINLSKQQIADRCFVDLQHIKNTYYTMKGDRK